MRFLKRLVPYGVAEPDATSPGPGLPASENAHSVKEAAAAAERRRAPFKCRACGRTRPPYVYAENAHHYCVDCARRSWKLMRLKPVSRRIEDHALEATVKEERAD